jgi:hypothetical protein
LAFTGRVNEFHALVFDPPNEATDHRQPRPRGMSSSPPRFAAERQSGIGPIRLMKDLQIDDFS